MGMGEPLYNFDNVATALRIVMDEQGIALSAGASRSRLGVVPMIPRVGRCSTSTWRVAACRERRGARHVVRSPQMAIAELLKACADYPGARNSRRITFEYAMLKASTTATQTRASWCASDAAARQGEPDPVQPVARRALRVQLQQPHAPLRRDRERRRAPARPSARRAAAISSRLRPAQSASLRRRGERVRDIERRWAFDLLPVEDGPDGVLLKLVAKKARRVALADKPRKRRETASARR